MGKSETVALMSVGATIAVLLRARKMYPWDMSWFVRGAVKGAMWGLAGAMALRAVFLGIDRLRGA